MRYSDAHKHLSIEEINRALKLESALVSGEDELFLQSYEARKDSCRVCYERVLYYEDASTIFGADFGDALSVGKAIVAASDSEATQPDQSQEWAFSPYRLVESFVESIKGQSSAIREQLANWLAGDRNIAQTLVPGSLRPVMAFGVRGAKQPSIARDTNLSRINITPLGEGVFGFELQESTQIKLMARCEAFEATPIVLVIAERSSEKPVAVQIRTDKYGFKTDAVYLESGEYVCYVLTE